MLLYLITSACTPTELFYLMGKRFGNQKVKENSMQYRSRSSKDVTMAYDIIAQAHTYDKHKPKQHHHNFPCPLFPKSHLSPPVSTWCRRFDPEVERLLALTPGQRQAKRAHIGDFTPTWLAEYMSSGFDSFLGLRIPAGAPQPPESPLKDGYRTFHRALWWNYMQVQLGRGRGHCDLGARASHSHITTTV